MISAKQVSLVIWLENKRGEEIGRIWLEKQREDETGSNVPPNKRRRELPLREVHSDTIRIYIYTLYACVSLSLYIYIYVYIILYVYI